MDRPPHLQAQAGACPLARLALPSVPPGVGLSVDLLALCWEELPAGWACRLAGLDTSRLGIISRLGANSRLGIIIIISRRLACIRCQDIIISRLDISRLDISRGISRVDGIRCQDMSRRACRAVVSPTLARLAPRNSQ